MREAEALQEFACRGLLVAGQRKQDVLGTDVRGAEVARLLVRSDQGRLRVRGERGRDVGLPALLGFLLDLGGDRLRIGIHLVEHVLDDIAWERGVEQVVGVEVEAAPLDCGPRRPLQELARGVAEVLGHVDPFRLALCRRGPATAARRTVAEEVGEEVVEEAAAAETAAT